MYTKACILALWSVGIQTICRCYTKEQSKDLCYEYICVLFTIYYNPEATLMAGRKYVLPSINTCINTYISTRRKACINWLLYRKQSCRVTNIFVCRSQTTASTRLVFCAKCAYIERVKSACGQEVQNPKMAAWIAFCVFF